MEGTVADATALDLDGERTAVAARAASRLAKLAEISLCTVDLTLPQYRLMCLLADGSAAATALAERLTVTRPSITALADGLVGRGYVERVPDPDDRRRIHHSLTPTGRAALTRGDEAIRARLLQTLAHLPARQARTALRGLALWNEALDTARTRREGIPGPGGDTRPGP